MRVVEKVEQLTKDVLASEGYNLVDLEFVKEGKNWFLRFFVDKEGGMDLDSCALVSERISDILDNADPDPIPQAYFLEVSSPGAERPLKTEEDLKSAIDQYIHVSFYQQVNQQKFIEGFLLAVDQETIRMRYREKTRVKELDIPRDNIAKVRLAIQF